MWIIELFSFENNASNLARLITILLASFLAFIGIFYVQRKTDLRENRKLRIEKMEKCLTLFKQGLRESEDAFEALFEQLKENPSRMLPNIAEETIKKFKQAVITLNELEALMVLHFFKDKNLQEKNLLTKLATVVSSIDKTQLLMYDKNQEEAIEKLRNSQTLVELNSLVNVFIEHIVSTKN